MAYVGVDILGDEFICNSKPEKIDNDWCIEGNDEFIDLPKGSIKKLIGRDLSFDDGCVKLF